MVIVPYTTPGMEFGTARPGFHLEKLFESG